jgi:hypothetical protein
MAICGWTANPEHLAGQKPGADLHSTFKNPFQRSFSPRFQIRRLNHLLCLYAGSRHGQRPHSGLLSSRPAKKPEPNQSSLKAPVFSKRQMQTRYQVNQTLHRPHQIYVRLACASDALPSLESECRSDFPGHAIHPTIIQAVLGLVQLPVLSIQSADLIQPPIHLHPQQIFKATEFSFIRVRTIHYLPGGYNPNSAISI